MKRSLAAMAMGLGLVLATSQLATARQDKTIDCAKAENAKRSECAKAAGQTRENARSNKGAVTTGAERSDTVQDLNAAREKKGGGKKN